MSEVPSVRLTLELGDEYLVLRGYFNRGGVFIEEAASTHSKGQHQAITEYLSGFRAAKELATNQETFLAKIKRIRSMV